MIKMETTSTAFYYISKNLEEEIKNGYINSIQTIDKNVWKIKIHRKKTKQLIINPYICFLSEYQIPVTNIGGFEKYLKKKLYNQKVWDIKQHKNNRLIYLKLDKYYLIFEFFSKSNIILTDNEFKIITSKQKEEWKDRTIKKGEIYKFPVGEDLKEKTDTEINLEFKDKEKKQIISELAKKYNIAPIESNLILEKNNLNNIKELYNYKNPLLTLKKHNNKDIITVTDNNKNNIYINIEKIFLEKYKEQKIESKNKKKQKLENILKEQKKTIKKFEEKISCLEKEAQQIYSYFTYIDEINKQIEKALKKKIHSNEIINKINNQLNKINQPLKIININQKNKTYKLEIIKK
jgi:predicted ribosome quality control (RQC) complex YloA/Tae2 family protein